MRRLAVLLVLLLASAPSWAAITFVQGKTCAANSSSEACAFTSNVGAGNFIAVCSGSRSASVTISSVTDGASHTWNLVDSARTNGNARNYLYYAKNTTAGAMTVTVTYSGSVQHSVSIAEFAGVSTTSPLDTDAHAFASDSTSPMRTGTITGTLDQANNLFIGCMVESEFVSNTANWSSPASLSTTTVTESSEGGSGTLISSAIEYEIRTGSTADEWIEATASQNQTSVLRIQAFKEAVATFTLTQSKAGAGKGRVTSSPAGVNCGTSCNSVFNTGTVVTLTAEPVGDSTFSGWSGDADCSDGSVTMSADRNCTATFALKTYYPLTISKTGSGTGLVRSAGREIDCGSDCYQQYIDGAVEWLNAYPDAGSVFAGWSGTGCPSSAVGGSVLMNTARSCTATFNVESGASELFFVNTGGQDDTTKCTGLAADAYDGSGGPDACAFATIGYALSTGRSNGFSCTNGDDVKIVLTGTLSEAVTVPTSCNCPSFDDTGNGPCIMQGGGVGTILDPGASAAAITAGGGSTGTRQRYLMVRDMRIKAGTAAGFRCATALYCTETALVDVAFTDFGQFGPLVNPPDAAVQFDASAVSQGIGTTDGNILDGVTIDGDETSCATFVSSNGAKFCGTRYANGVYAGGTQGIDIRNFDFRDIRGQAARIASGGIMQDGVISHAWSETEAVDPDGVITHYRADNVINRRILLLGAHSTTYQSGGTIRTRITAGANVPAGQTDYNDSFLGVGFAGAGEVCTGTTTSCGNNTWGSGLRRHVILNSIDGAGGTGYDEMDVFRNVITQAKGEGITWSIHTDSSPSTICPASASWKDNIIFDSDAYQGYVSPGSCTVTLGTRETAGVQVDPGLDPNGRPTAWAEACFVKDSGITARDGDVSDPWVGWSSGACLALTATCSNGTTDAGNGETDTDCGGSNCPKCANGETCAVNGDCVSNSCVSTVCTAAASTRKVINLIISRLSPGVPPAELWRHPLEPGEVIGIWEQ